MILPRASDPIYSPLKNVHEDVRDAIWDRILRFAFNIELHNGYQGSLEELNVTRTSVSQVSLGKTFNVSKGSI